MKLSILICTIPNRVTKFLPKLVTELEKQTKGKDVEFLYLGDNKQRRVGKKRNDLLRLAQGDYVVFVDDDDSITNDYVDELLKGIETGADVVCFRVLYTPDKKEVIYNKDFRRDSNTRKHYLRMPNHIMCIKRDLAMIGFREINFGEDADFAQRLRKTIRTQYSIDKVLYHYNFSHLISETQ